MELLYTAPAPTPEQDAAYLRNGTAINTLIEMGTVIQDDMWMAMVQEDEPFDAVTPMKNALRRITSPGFDLVKEMNEMKADEKKLFLGTYHIHRAYYLATKAGAIPEKEGFVWVRSDGRVYGVLAQYPLVHVPAYGGVPPENMPPADYGANEKPIMMVFHTKGKGSVQNARVNYY